MDDFSISPDAHWFPQPPASSDVIQSLLSASGLDLPEEYLAFLQLNNGGEGDLGIEPGWFQLWPAEYVIESNKQAWLPGFFGFGSNGGGELLAFDTREQPPWKVYMIPFGTLEEADSILVAESFAAFTRAMGHVLPEDQQAF
jgi:hypothetical protein